MTNNKII